MSRIRAYKTTNYKTFLTCKIMLLPHTCCFCIMYSWVYLISELWTVSVPCELFPGSWPPMIILGLGSSLLWFTLGLNLWPEVLKYHVIGWEGRCKAICITQPQIKPHKMKMHNFTLLRTVERDLTIHKTRHLILLISNLLFFRDFITSCLFPRL